MSSLVGVAGLWSGCLTSPLKYLYLFIYLDVLGLSCGRGIQFPDQGLNAGPLH